MLAIENGVLKYQNVSRTVPALTSSDTLSALFEARKAGIFTWDDAVEQQFNSLELDPVVKSFLTSEKPGNFEIDSEKTPIQCLTDIVNHSTPTLFVIPGGSEISKTKMIYNFLVNMGYNNTEMSVMFRLPNNEGREFNEFVKNCGLNNPIGDNTKFVFVSIKLPKPVIKSKIKFDSVISLGRSNVHYTIREFFKNRHNLIYYCESTKQKEFNFGNL
jgi:preprotein translocase subunit SecD